MRRGDAKGVQSGVLPPAGRRCRAVGGGGGRWGAVRARVCAARLQLAHPALDGLPRAQLRLLRAVLLLERADLLRERLVRVRARVRARVRVRLGLGLGLGLG